MFNHIYLNLTKEYKLEVKRVKAPDQYICIGDKLFDISVPPLSEIGDSLRAD